MMSLFRSFPLLACIILAQYFPGTGNAQIRITRAVHQPAAGDGFHRKFFSPTGVSPGSPGTQATWDFSGINYTQASDSGIHQIPGAPAPGWNYNLEFLFDLTPPPLGPFSKDFYLVSDSAFSYAGRDHQITDLDPWQYDDPKLLLKWPMEYGDSLFDTYQGTHNSIGGPVRFDGSWVVRVAGPGPLILPQDTIQNVLRIHYTDSLWETFNSNTTLTVSEEFHYYAADRRYPWLVLRAQGALEPSYTVDFKGTGNTSSYSPQLPTLTVYPNPFQTSVKLRLPSGQMGPFELRIVDLHGKTIRKEVLAYQDEVSLELEVLPVGPILLILSNDEDKKWVSRLLKTRN